MILKLIFILALSLSLVGNTEPKKEVDEKPLIRNISAGGWQVQHLDVSYEIGAR